MENRHPVRLALLMAAIVAISGSHYMIATTETWAHTLLQRLYYIPLLLVALSCGWRAGIAASLLASALYVPHIVTAWHANHEYRAAQYYEIAMFFVITALTGVLSDYSQRQRRKAEENLERLKEANAKLQASFEQLRRADRLAALGQLSAGLAHEIRNPLGSVEGAIQILRRESVPTEVRQEFGELADRELSRLNGLLTQFLNFARPQPPQRIPSDPNLLLESVAKLASETATLGGVRIRTELWDSMPPISFDPEQIRQVLLNLVINAVQAMPDGGEIVLCSRYESDSVLLQVVDEGVGISPENLQRIFDPFFTTRQAGTGLGLAIAYRIINQHNGDISTERNRDKGMTFTIRLPLTVRETAEETAVQAKA